MFWWFFIGYNRLRIPMKTDIQRPYPFQTTGKSPNFPLGKGVRQQVKRAGGRPFEPQLAPPSIFSVSLPGFHLQVSALRKMMCKWSSSRLNLCLCFGFFAYFFAGAAVSGEVTSDDQYGLVKFFQRALSSPPDVQYFLGSAHELQKRPDLSIPPGSRPRPLATTWVE